MNPLFGLDSTHELLTPNGYYSMMVMILNTAGMLLPDNAALLLNSL